MDNIVLVGIIVLGVILAIIAMVLILKKPKETNNVTKVEVEDDYLDFEDLMAIAKNPNTTSDRLLYILEYFNNNYIIDDQNEQKYLVFLSRVLTHNNVNKDVFQYFHNEVKSKNVRYKNDLDIIESKALG
jgi:hypothetical protein